MLSKRVSWNPRNPPLYALVYDIVLKLDRCVNIREQAWAIITWLSEMLSICSNGKTIVCMCMCKRCRHVITSITMNKFKVSMLFHLLSESFQCIMRGLPYRFLTRVGLIQVYPNWDEIFIMLKFSSFLMLFETSITNTPSMQGILHPSIVKSRMKSELAKVHSIVTSYLLHKYVTYFKS